MPRDSKFSYDALPLRERSQGRDLWGPGKVRYSIVSSESGYTLQDHNVAVSRFSKSLSNAIRISCLVLLGLNLWGKSSKQND